MTSLTGARRLLLVAAAIVVLFAFPAVAAAHAELVRAIPADGSTVSEPVTVISARYSEDLVTGSGLEVLDSGGTTLATGGIDPGDVRRMVARLDQPLTVGRLDVRSTAISADGHVERTEWSFGVDASPTKALPTSSPSDSLTPSATTSPTPPATATSMPSSSPDPGTPTSSAGDVLLPIIAALAIVLVGAGFLLSRGRAAR